MDGFAESYHLKVLHKTTIVPNFEGVPGLTDGPPWCATSAFRTTIAKELKKDFADQRFVRHGTIQSLTRPFNERLIAAVQAQCDFEDGDLRAICVEAQPILGSTPHWRIVDAKRGVVDQNHADLAKRKPWDYGEA